MRVLGRDLATLKLALGWTPGLALLAEFGDCLSAYLVHSGEVRVVSVEPA
jgi:hypothetical protein